MDLQAAKALLSRLSAMTALRSVRDLSPAHEMMRLLSACCDAHPVPETFIARYTDVYGAFLDGAAQGSGGFLETILSQVAYGTHAFARIAIRLPYDELPYSVIKAMRHDLAALGALARLEPAQLLALAARICVPQELTDPLPAWESGVPGTRLDSRLRPEMLDAEGLPLLCAFYQVQGTGLFARYPGLYYVGETPEHPDGWVGVDTPDPIVLSDLLRYESQRRVLVENTGYLLAGRGCANILLYGDKGTGKSATVKALLNAYAGQGLRIVEVPPAALTHLPRIFALLRTQPCKFIVFVDDLAFQDSCPEYTALKTVLEGGLEARPQNVAVYATSNRQNLVRQRFSERSDDVSERDTLEEKFSLADRFDIRLTFHVPTQEEYLEIAMQMAARQGVHLAEEILRERALRWSVRRASTSPRTARQFIDSLVRNEDA